MTLGNLLIGVGGRCTTISIVAGKSVGSGFNRHSNALIAPADPSITVT